MAFISPISSCGFIKVSDYTIQSIDRHSAAFFGNLMKLNDVQLYCSMRESHLKYLFELFDTDRSGSFEYEVCHFCVRDLCYFTLTL